MEINQLETFLTLAKTKNFTKTAEILHLAQSTVTARIKGLEEELDKPLFNRSNKAVELTSAGKTFLSYAERIVSLSYKSKEVLQLEEQYEGKLVLGGPASVWNYALQQQVSGFIHYYPTIAIELVTDTSENTLQKVLDGIMHVGLVYEKPRHPQLRVELIKEDDYVLVGKRLFERPVTVKDFYHHRFIFKEYGKAFSAWFTSLVGEKYIPPFKVNNTELLLKKLIQEEAFGFIPRSIYEEVADNRLTILAHDIPSALLPKHHIYLISLKSNATCSLTNIGVKALKNEAVDQHN